jgi:adenylate kinase
MYRKVGRLTILGPSWGGKGTQAELLEEKYGWKHISVGSLFREHIDKNTEIGQEANKYVKQGQWVPTELTFKMLKPVLSKLIKKGFILDGFPRLPDQPEILSKFLAEKNTELDMVIHIDIRPEIIMERRKKAWKKGKSFYDQKRKDETEEAIETRIKEYQRTIDPILDYYRNRNNLFRVDGERSIESIHLDIIEELKERL